MSTLLYETSMKQPQMKQPQTKTRGTCGATKALIYYLLFDSRGKEFGCKAWFGGFHISHAWPARVRTPDGQRTSKVCLPASVYIHACWWLCNGKCKPWFEIKKDKEAE